MLRSVKRGFFILLSSHHPNNRLETEFICTFYTLFNSAAKKQFLGRKILEGHSPPPASPKLRLLHEDTEGEERYSSTLSLFRRCSNDIPISNED